MSLFDKHRKLAHGPVEALYGDSLTWTPHAGGPAQTLLVLFYEPTEQEDMSIRTGKALYSSGEAMSEVIEPYFEYQSIYLTGLDVSVAAGNTEMVTVKGKTYAVKQIKAKNDGFLKTAILEPQ